MTSIFCVFQNQLDTETSTEKFEIYFDLNAPEGALEDQFVSIPANEVNLNIHFPLRSIFDASRFFEIASNLSPDKKEKVLFLQRKFQEFQIPLEVIEFENKEEIAIIFERVNRAGIRLDAFQLLSAWTWSSEFDLNESITELSTEIEPFGFSELTADPNLFMKCCAAVVNGDAQIKDVVNLHGPTVRESFSRIKSGILGAIDFLRRQLQIENFALMPYPAMLVPLTAFFASDKPSGFSANADQNTRILEWYWRSCIARRYSSGVGRAHSADIAFMLALRNNPKQDVFRYSRPIDSDFFTSNRFSISNVNSRILINLLSQKRPRSLLSGAAIDLQNVLQKANRNEFHHIFPKAHLRKEGHDNDSINALSNICFLSKNDNIRIKDKAPFIYQKLMDQAQIDLVLESNMIPSNFHEISFQEFSEKRAELLASYINRLAGMT